MYTGIIYVLHAYMLDLAILQGLSKVRCLPLLVHVEAAHCVVRQAHSLRDLLDPLLCKDEALWAAKAAERSVRGLQGKWGTGGGGTNGIKLTPQHAAVNAKALYFNHAPTGLA